MLNQDKSFMSSFGYIYVSPEDALHQFLIYVLSPIFDMMREQKQIKPKQGLHFDILLQSIIIKQCYVRRFWLRRLPSDAARQISDVKKAFSHLHRVVFPQRYKADFCQSKIPELTDCYQRGLYLPNCQIEIHSFT